MATYYWVGGTGTWSGTGNTQFAITSGGVPTALNPTAADTVIFDANSGTAATVTVTATAVSSVTTLNKADLTLSLSGSPILCTGAFTFTTGAIALNNFSLSIGVLSSTNTNTRSIAFGASGRLLITSSGTSILLLADATNFSYTGTSYVGLTYSGSTGTRTVRLGYTAGTTASNAMNVYISAGADIINLAIACNTLDFTGFSGSVTNAGATTFYGNLVISSGMTWSAAATALSFVATSGIQKITTNGKTLDCPITQNGAGGTVQLQDNLTMGSTRTFTLTNGVLDLTGNSGNWALSTGLFSSSNSNTRSIAFGTGKIQLTGNNGFIWAQNTGTGFSYTGTSRIECTYAGSTGTRSLTTARTNAGGTEANSLNFYVTAGTDIFTFGSTSYPVKNLDLTGFSGTFTPNACFIFGDLVISSGVSLTSSATLGIVFIGSVTQLITTAGKTFDFPLTFGTSTFNSNATFQDALTQGSTRTTTFSQGTIKFKAGTTNTVGSFVTSGTIQKYLQSTVAGSQATLSQASGTVGVSYLTIQDINATGGATWNAFYDNGNIDAGNNTNWNFGGTPSYDAEYGYKLRSFTEHGRF